MASLSITPAPNPHKCEKSIGHNVFLYTDRVKCQKCGVAVQDEALECPGCGVIFAKLKGKSERDKREAALGLDQAQAPKAPDIDLWRGRKIAAGIILLWIVACVLYYRHAIAVIKLRAG